MEKIMPDLFVVMSDDELVEAVEYAHSLGATHAKSLTAMNYDLLINGTNMETHFAESGKWFPEFIEYVNLPTDDDEIGILLSPAVWNTYDQSRLYQVLRENNISFDIEYDPIFIRPRQLLNKIAKEKIQFQENPINSPWTARDTEVVETALTSIRGISKATLLKNANFAIAIYVNDFNNTVDEFLIASEVAKKKYVEKFLYPNVLHLESEEGIFNVYMGPDVDLSSIMASLENARIDTIIKEYEDADKDLLLYAACEPNLKLI